MANNNTTKVTNITADPAVNVDAAEAHGRMRVWYDSFEASSTASGDTITFSRMPKGATIYQVRVMADALGSSVTIKVGDASDDDRYITATTMNTANLVTETNAIAGVAYNYTAETDLIATVGGAAATGTIKFMVFYSLGD